MYPVVTRLSAGGDATMQVVGNRKVRYGADAGRASPSEPLSSCGLGRQRREPPRTYWEEYVETDTWYQKKLIEDVPEEELHAALIDEDFEDDGWRPLDLPGLRVRPRRARGDSIHPNARAGNYLNFDGRRG